MPGQRPQKGHEFDGSGGGDGEIVKLICSEERAIASGEPRITKTEVFTFSTARACKISTSI